MSRWLNRLVKSYGETNMENRRREYTHMITWLNVNIYWYRDMVKQIWWNGAKNTHPCSHGEMEIWWSGAVHRTQRLNCLIIKLLYSPLTVVGFLVPYNYGDMSHFFTELADVSHIDEKFVCEWCRDDRLNGPWVAAPPFDAMSPDFVWSIYPFRSPFHFSYYRQHRGGCRF